MNATMMPDLRRIASALSHIPSSNRDLWVKMGMAVKSELPDEEGFSIWSDWSQSDESYKEPDARSTWKSIDPSGGIGIGSLFFEAVQNGWHDTGAVQIRTAADLAQRRADQAKADEAQLAQTARKQAAARKKAERLWAIAKPVSPDHPYLVRKKVIAVGTLREIDAKKAAIILGYAPKQSGEALTGRLLVAPIKIDPVLTTCELIDGDGRKSAIAGGTKSGAYWATRKLPAGDGSGLTVAICEGVATTLSVTMASAHLGIAALSAGNLARVADTMRKRYPAAVIILAADIDKRTGKPDQHAVDAALAVGGRLAIPVFGADRTADQTDFNDLHQIEGLQALRHCIDAATVAAAVDMAGEFAGAENTGNGAPKMAHVETGFPFGFTLSKAGVFYTPEGTDDKPGRPMRVCAPLRVTALIRDRASENWGRVIEFNDPDGVHHQWPVPMEMMAGDGADMRRELSRLGLGIGASMAAKNRLSEYLIACQPAARARCVQQTGWFDNVFVMPDRTIGASNEVVLYQSESKTVCQYLQAGKLDMWRNEVARLCIGNSRLIFAVSAAFAGMILRHAGQESGGLHFVGSSSTGKSTAQLVAASVYGSPSFKQSWRATGNALEGTCALHNDTALILDEMAEVDPKDVGSIVYMIGNGTGKGRASRTGDARQRKAWRLMIISSGEIGLAQHMRDGGKTAKAGQEVRMIDIAADAGAGHGLFEELHGHEGGAVMADAIKEATQSYYGTPAISFLERLTSEQVDFSASLKTAMKSFVEQYLPADAGGQAARVCNKFAVIAIAGEYATGAGITGWQQGDAVAAVGTCFKSWLESRGGGGNQERAAILSSVKAFFESHGESRFADIDDSTNRVTINRAGFRKANSDGQEYFVLSEAYKRDVCVGFDMKTVSKVLTDAGWLDQGKDSKTSQSRTLPGMGKTRCYVFTSKMWEA